MLLGLATMLLVCLAAEPLDLLTGIPRVIDGDTIELAGMRGRLGAIDAPENRQTCASERGRSWACGRSAAEQLARLTAGGVACVAGGTDRYGRALLDCILPGGRDLSGAMVASGLALAYRAYSRRYLTEEGEARRRQAGVWQGAFEDPWSYRKRRRKTAALDVLPASCRIKGNISPNGRIYHLPGSHDYARTRIEASSGERWFCDEAEAQAAGWRAPRRG